MTNRNATRRPAADRINPEYSRRWEAGRIHYECTVARGDDAHDELASMRRLDAEPTFLASFEHYMHRAMLAD
jgi:hypothetical protein